jgi:hypothetical protein
MANGHDAMIRGVTTPPINGTVFALAEWCLSASASPTEYLNCNCSKVPTPSTLEIKHAETTTLAGEQPEATTTTATEAAVAASTTNVDVVAAAEPTAGGDTAGGDPGDGGATTVSNTDAAETIPDISLATTEAPNTAPLADGGENSPTEATSTATTGTWTGPFNMDIDGIGFGGSIAADLGACKARCMEDPLCKAIQFSATDHESADHNCFTFDNQDDTNAQYKTYQIYKVTRQAATAAPMEQAPMEQETQAETFPNCMKCLDGNCQCGGISGRCCKAAQEGDAPCTDDSSPQCEPCKMCNPEGTVQDVSTGDEALNSSVKQQIVTAKAVEDDKIAGATNTAENPNGASSISQVSACLSIGLILALSYP